MPDAGYVLGVDSNGRNAQSQKMNPPAHSMSGLRLATTQREGLRGTVSGLLLAMRDESRRRCGPRVDMEVGNMAYPAAGYGPFTVAFDPQTGLPVRVRTLDYDNIWGDVTYDLVLSDWRDFSGVKVRDEPQVRAERPHGAGGAAHRLPVQRAGRPEEVRSAGGAARQAPRSRPAATCPTSG